MKTEVLLRSIGKINDELIADAESEANTKRKPGWAKLGIMAACLALVLAVALVIPTLTRQDQSIITENEPKIELTLNEAMNDKTFGMLFPKQILEGYPRYLRRQRLRRIDEKTEQYRAGSTFLQRGDWRRNENPCCLKRMVP